MSEAGDDSENAALAIFRQLVPDRAQRLRGDTHNAITFEIIAEALKTRYGEAARDIAFHLADWNSDAAFILAMHLFPERFTPEQILDGVEDFLIHAPNHVAAAAKLGGHPIEDIFEVGALDAASDDDAT